MIDFTGKSIIVTGGASGIGAVTARLLAGRGAEIVIADVDRAGEGVAEAIRVAGGAAIFIDTDVGDEASVAAMVAAAVARFGRLDGAFNNAGVEQSGVRLADLTIDRWDRAIRIDLTGVFLCLKHEVRAMLASGGGAIVNTSSGLGQVAIPGAGEYIAAKHGVIGLTRAAAIDYARDNIRVNAILPGMIATPMVARLGGDPGFVDQLRQAHPVGRLGEAAEIAEAAAWLLSDAASFITGAAVPVDGGYLAV